MAVTNASSGTQAATVTTEHTLFDTSSAGSYTLHVDKSNMVAGDVLELRVYQMVVTAGTRRVAYVARFAGVQPTDDMIAISVPVSTPLTDAGALRFTLKQAAGTSRNFIWAVYRYG